MIRLAFFAPLIAAIVVAASAAVAVRQHTEAASTTFEVGISGAFEVPAVNGPGRSNRPCSRPPKKLLHYISVERGRHGAIDRSGRSVRIPVLGCPSAVFVLAMYCVDLLGS